MEIEKNIVEVSDYIHTHGVNGDFIKDVVEQQRVILDFLIESLEPAEIVIDVMNTIKQQPDIFGSSTRVITHLLLPMLYKNFKEISNEEKKDNDNQFESKNKKTVIPTTGVKDVIEYIKLASQTWYGGKFNAEDDSAIVSCSTRLPDHLEGKTKGKDDGVRYVDDNIALVLANFLSNVTSRRVLPLALNLCSAFLLAIQKRYMNSTYAEEVNGDNVPNIKWISYHYTLWVTSLSKFTLKDIENFEILRSLLRLCQSYYLMFSMSIAVSCKANQKYQMPLGESETVTILSLTVKWIITAFKKDEKSIMWSATNILQNITMFDQITNLFFNHLNRDTIAELTILMLMKVRDHFKDENNINDEYPEGLMCENILKVLRKAYTLSKEPFIREVMDASIKIYKIDNLIDNPFSLERDLAATQ